MTGFSSKKPLIKYSAARFMRRLPFGTSCFIFRLKLFPSVESLARLDMRKPFCVISISGEETVIVMLDILSDFAFTVVASTKSFP